LKKFCINKNLIFIVLIVIAIVFSTFVFIETRRKDIRQASIQEIESIDKIGSILAPQIKDYAVKNNINTVDDLHVKNVGEKRKAELKKKYK
jgi:hypothetical protein